MWNIFRALKPLLYVSFILGLAPFRIEDDPESLKVSSWGSAYTLFVLVLYAGCSVFGIREKVHRLATSYTYIGEYSSLVLLICGIAVAICSLLLILIQRKKITAMINNFHSIDSQMARLDVRMPYDRYFRHYCFVILGLFVLLVGLVFHDYLSTKKKRSLLSWVTYFSPVVLTIFMQCQFISGGLLLKKNYTSLNERLMQLRNEKELMEGDLKKAEVIDGGYGNYFGSHLILGRKSTEVPTSHAWESTFSRYRSRKIVPQNDGSIYPTSILNKIKILRKIHSNLCETKELLNSSYSLQLLVVVAQAFVLITTNLYTLFTTGDKGEKNELISVPIIWASYRSVELICITVTCSKISKTANHTAVIVHKLLSEEWEPSIRNQLKLFSIQLLHRKISFTASGFFTLDMTLLHAIIGAATTYLVILVQFHNMYETS